jgi:hypothetical protein
MRHVAIDAELVSGPQVPLAAAVDVEPHLALHDQRPHRERMGVSTTVDGARLRSTTSSKPCARASLSNASNVT